MKAHRKMLELSLIGLWGKPDRGFWAIIRSRFEEDAAGPVAVTSYPAVGDGPPWMKVRTGLVDNVSYMPIALLALHAEQQRIAEQHRLLRRFPVRVLGGFVDETQFVRPEPKTLSVGVESGE